MITVTFHHFVLSQLFLVTSPLYPPIGSSSGVPVIFRFGGTHFTFLLEYNFLYAFYAFDVGYKLILFYVIIVSQSTWWIWKWITYRKVG